MKRFSLGFGKKKTVSLSSLPPVTVLFFVFTLNMILKFLIQKGK